MNRKVANTSAINEPNMLSALKLLDPILDPAFGLITEIHRVHQYYDEPKFWHFSARVNAQFIRNSAMRFKSVGSGCSFFSREEALLKCLAESVERFSNNYFSESFITRKASFKDVKNEVIPFNTFARYSEDQLKNKIYSKFVFKPDSTLGWTACESLTSDTVYLVPCNFVYLSYPFTKKEPVLYPPISTGVAAGWTFASAILRGLYETIERDAFMIAYLKKIRYPELHLDSIKDKKIQFFRETIKKYDMELRCFDFTTNLEIPVICAIVLDKTGIGKAMSMGLRSNVNIYEALVGAITESFHTRGWIRNTHEMDDASYEKELKNARDPGTILRGLFWFDVQRLKKLDFWLGNTVYKDIGNHSISHTVEDELVFVMNKLAANHMDMYWKDITVHDLSHLGLKVVKTIVPQLQPLTFEDEKQPQGGLRLDDVPRASGYAYSNLVNTYPHPFI